jgi:mercuric ion transport protein
MTDAASARRTDPAAQPATRSFAALGALGAVLVHICCLVPLALVSVGVTGAWIGQLPALAPFHPVFAAAALVFIGLGFRKVYFQPKAACADGYCARTTSGRVTEVVLWGSTLLTLAGLSSGLWLPLVFSDMDSVDM